MTDQTQKTLTELLNAIEQRANAATCGPWVSAVSEKHNRAINIYAGNPFAESGKVVAWAIPQSGAIDEPQANADFIAASRFDVPALVRLARRQAEIIESLLGHGTYVDDELTRILREFFSPSVPDAPKSSLGSE